MTERRKMPGWAPGALLAAFAVLLVAGIAVVWFSGRRPPSPASTTNQSPGVTGVRLSPTHTGGWSHSALTPSLYASQGFLVETPHNEFYLGYRVELWRDGRPGPMLDGGRMLVRDATELNFTLWSSDTANKPKTYESVVEIRQRSGDASLISPLKEFLPPPDPKENQMTFGVVPKHWLELFEGEPTPVWAYVVGDNDRPRPSDLRNAIDTSRYALVLFLWWEHAKR